MGSLYRQTVWRCTVCGRTARASCRDAGHALERRDLPTIWIKYYQNGRAIRESTETTKETVAKRILKSREGDVEHGIPINPQMGRVTVEDAAQDVINDYTANKKASLAELTRRINKHLLPYFRGRRMGAITTSDVRAYIAKRQADEIVTGKGDTERRRHVSNGEINRELTTLKRMFSLAIESAKLLHKPHIPMLREDNIRVGFFEREQFESVRAELPAYAQPLVTFMYLTGWRRSEVTSLEWRQVDFKAGTVTLDPGTTKNDEGRVFPMTAELRELLVEQDLERDRLKKAGHIVPWVFFRMVGTTGSRRQRRKKEPRAIGCFRKVWIIACRAAGCPGRIPHDFRRTAVRNLVRAGIPERVAMTMTGHKTRSVFERYNIVSAGDLRDAARKLDELRGHNSGHSGGLKAAVGAESSSQVVAKNGAGDRDRTGDIRLGKPAFYR